MASAASALFSEDYEFWLRIQVSASFCYYRITFASKFLCLLHLQLSTKIFQVLYKALSVTLYSLTMNLGQADNKLILSHCFTRMLHSLQRKVYTLHSTLSDIHHIWSIFDNTVDSYSFVLQRFFSRLYRLRLHSSNLFIFNCPRQYFGTVHITLFIYTHSHIKLLCGCFSSLPISKQIHHRALISARKTLHSTLYLLLMSFFSYIHIWTLAKITLRQLLSPISNCWVRVFFSYTW